MLTNVQINTSATTTFAAMHYDQQLRLEECVAAGVTVFMRRYDLLHPEISGNKQFKLKYWLRERQSNQPVLSFGGAYSNHLLALSAAGKENDFETVGIIRGENPEKPSPWLLRMEENGMELEYISRQDYRAKEVPEFIGQLKLRFNNALIIPEGGAGLPGIKGASEMIDSNEPYDWIVIPGGTGTTLAGIAIKAQNTDTRILGIQVLKGKSILRNEVLRTSGIDLDQFPNLKLDEEHHFGGYGKTNNELEAFRADWFNKTSIPIDHVYMAKTIYATLKKINEGFFTSGARILLIHTGGNGPDIK